MNVLIADEFAIYRFLIKTYVKKCWPNANLFEAGTLTEAVSEITKTSFNLVILDIRLPGSKGLEAFFANVDKDFSVVVFSQDPIDEIKAQRLRNFGVDKTILKSINSGEIIEGLLSLYPLPQAKFA